MCCNKPPQAPDLTPYAQASERAAELANQTAREQLSWSREQDAMNRGVLNRVLDIQLPAMQDQFANAREDRQRYETVFRPIEDNLVQDFQNYGTPQQKDLEMSRAMSSVAQNFDAQRRNALQRLESYGVDPTTTRAGALDIGMRTQQAAAMAGAGTSAERLVEDKGRALRADAINIGRGLPSQVAQSYGQSVAAGQAGVGGANQTTGTSAGAMQGANSFMNTALQGYGQGANIMSQGYGNQLAGWGAGQQQSSGMLGGLGQIAGMVFMADGGDVDPTVTGPAKQALKQNGMFSVTGPGDGSGIDDQVPARLSEGEYVIPADVVAAKGTEFFDKLVEKYHTPAAQQRRALGE